MPGYRAKILDGNHLAGTEHRVPATRATRAAALPGQALVVLDPATMLVIDVVPCEDAHAQERSLVDQVLPGVEPGDLWIADRNSCTTRLLFGVLAGRGSFLIRQHKSTLYWEEATAWSEAGRVATGSVSEQAIRVTDPESGGVVELRRIRLVLDNPTRSKDKELFLVTDVPSGRASAPALADAYRRRWALEVCQADHVSSDTLYRCPGPSHSGHLGVIGAGPMVSSTPRFQPGSTAMRRHFERHLPPRPGIIRGARSA